MKWDELEEEPCSLARTVAVIGDRWSLLILRDIADDVQMHESTISRVVTNKYMHSPRGIFEMKYFFTTGYRPASLRRRPTKLARPKSRRQKRP